MANFVNVRIQLLSANDEEFFFAFKDKRIRTLPKVISNKWSQVYYKRGGDDWRTVKVCDDPHYPHFVGSCDCQLGLIIHPSCNEFYVVNPYDYDALSQLNRDELLATLITYPQDKIIAMGTYKNLSERRRLPFGMIITSVNKDYKSAH